MGDYFFCECPEISIYKTCGYIQVDGYMCIVWDRWECLQCGHIGLFYSKANSESELTLGWQDGLLRG